MQRTKRTYSGLGRYTTFVLAEKFVRDSEKTARKSSDQKRSTAIGADRTTAERRQKNTDGTTSVDKEERRAYKYRVMDGQIERTPRRTCTGRIMAGA